MLPTWAYATAVGTLVGYFWAAREKSSLLKSFWQALRLNILTNVGIVGLLLLTAPWVVPVFAKNDPLIVRQVQKDLYMIAVSLLLMPASAILISAVVAVGQTIQAFLVEVGIIGLYLAYIFWLSEVLHAPLTILWSAEWVYWIPSTLILGWLFQRSLRLMRESPKTIPAIAS
jgi:Na+-driven multidrug efflux pump